MSACPQCSGKMKSVTREIAIDENLGGGRVVRSYKSLSRMVCKKCGYVQMTDDAIANSAWMNAGGASGDSGLDAETASLIIVAIAVLCMGLFVGLGLCRNLGLWWKLLISVGAVAAIGWLQWFVSLSLDDHPGWTLMLLLLPILLVAVWWWPLSHLAWGWKILISAGAFLVSFVIGGLTDTLAGQT